MCRTWTTPIFVFNPPPPLYRQFYIYNNPVNIGLVPAEGLLSPKISLADIHKEKLQFKMLPLEENCLLTSRKLEAIGSKSSVKEVS